MAKILVVDDDETDRVSLSSILEQAGHTVVLARDGDEALRMRFLPSASIWSLRIW